MACGEFDLIARYFNRAQPARADVCRGIGDDAALLAVAPGEQLAVSSDTLVEGQHFLSTIDPADLGEKALAVNLSDMAAMGARPAWLMLALTLPHSDEHWLAAFSDSLFALLQRYAVQLIGGDTTRGPLSLTLTIFGTVPCGQALTRSGTQVGDEIWVTGTLGDSAAGLALLQNQLHVTDPAVHAYLVHRHLRPQARVEAGLALRGLATAAIDISDGLLADLGHILHASRCGAHLHLDAFPCSSALRQAVDRQQRWRWMCAGGEDYELCFTAPVACRTQIEQALQALDVPCARIGEVRPLQEGTTLYYRQQPVTLPVSGFDHFA